ncbi:MAG: hypothetical protein WD850_00705 [Candidatus Spechtbacterales bacterium]
MRFFAIVSAHKLNKNRLVLVVGIGLVVVLVGVASALYFGERGSDEQTSIGAQDRPANDYALEAKWWAERIDTIGPEDAYEEFKHAYQQESYARQHTLAHIFGRVLYEKAGIEGFAICDSAFAFGCYHSFFGTSIKADGMSIVKELDGACRRRWGGAYMPCQHGIGHGILSSLGANHLQDALDVCSTIMEQPTGGCASGIFMEYNFRTMSAVWGEGERTLVRPLRDERDVHMPCALLPQQYTSACYYEQPQWWEFVLGEDYERSKALCAEITEEDARGACFRGVGHYRANNGYDIEKVHDVCGTIAAGMPEQLFCYQGAAWLFLARQNGGADTARALCEAIKREEDRAVCSASIEGNIFRL